MIPKEVKFYCQLKILYTFLIGLIRKTIKKTSAAIIKVIIDTLLYNQRSAIGRNESARIRTYRPVATYSQIGDTIKSLLMDK